MIQDGGQIISGTNNSSSTGAGGNLTVNASESVEMIGGKGDFPSVLSSVTDGEGDAGKIKITTRQLSVRDGAQIQTSTDVDSKGNAGNLEVNVSEFIHIIGTTPGGEFPSALVANTSGIGNAGKLILNGKQLLIDDGAEISASTSGGEGGSIFVDFNSLEAKNGGRLRTSTSANNRAGSITLKVADNIILSGADSGIFANTTPESQGDGGNIFIDPPRVTIRDGAKIAVDSQGTGIGGDVELIAGFLTLDNGEITAATRSNTGGDVTLNLQELLLLRNGTKISTTAGNNQFGGDGGNITINSPFIVAVSQEDSDITANAFSGRGGRVDIKTDGIFGIQSQSQLTDFSDITASSDLGVDGEIFIDNPDVNPSKGVEELPADVVNAAGLINQNLCTAARRGSEFVIIGRGGLPASPHNVGNVNSTWEDWSIARESEISPPKPIKRDNQSTRKNESKTPIVEAQGWIFDNNGDIIFTAFPVQVTAKDTWLHPNDCQRLRVNS